MAEQYDPEETLKQLKDDLQNKESEITQKTGEREILKSKIASLEKVVNELKPVMNTYGQVLENFRKEKDDIEKYLETKIPMIHAAVQENKDEIDNEINKFNEEISEKEKKLDQIKERYDISNEGYQSAQGEVIEKQRNYDDQKNYQKNISGKIDDLKNLKKEIGQEGEKRNTANMYFLSEEMTDVIGKTDIISQEDLRKKLFDTWNALYMANEDLRLKKDEWEKTKKEFETAQSDLKALESNRRKEILQRISKFNPPNT
jgi:chromosome segregation ATPase